jgi:hypothetical protein
MCCACSLEEADGDTRFNFNAVRTVTLSAHPSPCVAHHVRVCACGCLLSRRTPAQVVNPHDFEDTYLPSFRAAVTVANASGVMCSYNAINGVPACGSDTLLGSILRDAWGFDGWVHVGVHAWAWTGGCMWVCMCVPMPAGLACPRLPARGPSLTLSRSVIAVLTCAATSSVIAVRCQHALGR